ncbi:MAG: M6 family metalloprotease domain-containing protein [Bacteroidota bacterium]
MSTRKYILSFLLSFSAWMYVSAQQTSVYTLSPYPNVFHQPDNSMLLLKGKGQYPDVLTQTIDGYTVVKNQNGFFEYALPSIDGVKLRSGKIAHNPDERNENEKKFLTNLAKDIIPFPFNPVSNENNIASKAIAHTTGHKNVLLLAIGFPDIPQYVTASGLDSLMNISGWQGAGSFRDYFLKNSGDSLSLTIDISGWYTASQNHVYYSATSGMNRPRQLVAEAVDSAEAHGVDFSQYDNDNDGVVDGVIVVHSGPGAEEAGLSEYIWSQTTDLGAFPRNYDGVSIYYISIVPETRSWGRTGIGVYCHEFGHLLGFPDLYDPTNASYGIGAWDCMSFGSWLGNEYTPSCFSAWTKTSAGWGKTTSLIAPGSYMLPQAADSNRFYKIAVAGTSEYFLLENRMKTGFDAALPGEGLAIWHIDQAVINNNLSTNQVNHDVNHKGVDLEEADALLQMDQKINTGDAGDLYPGTSANIAFNSLTNPSSNTYSGSNSGIRIDEISNYSVYSFFNFINCKQNVVARPDTSIFAGDTLPLYVSLSQPFNTTSYVWSPPQSMSYPAIASPIAFPTLTTTYTVTVTDVICELSFTDQMIAEVKIFKEKSSGIPSVSWGAMAAADIDNDKDVDLFICGQTAGGLDGRMMINDSGNFNNSVLLPAMNLSAVAFCDYDHDGWNDLLIAGSTASGNKTFLYKNTNGIFTEVSTLFPGLSSPAIAWGDFDNDGLPDLALSGAQSKTVPYNSIFKIYHNNGSSFTEHASFEGIISGSLVWADFDKDGYLDLLLTGSDVQIPPHHPVTRIYKNNKGVFSDMQLSLEGVYAGSASADDINRDGFPDFVVSGISDAGPVCILYANNGNFSFTADSTLFPMISTGVSRFTDVDDDGYSDVVISGYNGSQGVSALYMNTGSGFVNVNTPLPALYYASSAIADFDNDGDNDIMISGFNGASIASSFQQNRYNSNVYAHGFMPAAPQNLKAVADTPGTTLLSWSAPSNAMTKANGISYNFSLTKLYPEEELFYNATFENSGCSSTGNVYRNNSVSLNNLEEGGYTFAVQSVDNGFRTSAFSKSTFVVPHFPESDSIFIYPNPVSESITFTFPPTAANTQWTIVNTLGEVMMKGVLPSTQKITITVSGLSQGMYLLRMTDAGSRIHTGKFVKV